MSRIAPCDKHAAMWTGVDLAADTRWGYVAGSAIINGITEAIVCHECQWATAPAVEKTLGSVGNPTDRRIRGNDASQCLSEYDAPELPPRKTKVKKEKKMAKATEPKKRERRRGTVLTRTIGNMTITLRAEGNVLDIPKEKRDAFWQLVDLMKALDEPPHA